MEVQAIVGTLITVLDLIERVNLNKTVSSEDREKIIAERTKLRKFLVEEANAPLGEDQPSDDTSESSTPDIAPDVVTSPEQDEVTSDEASTDSQ